MPERIQLRRTKGWRKPEGAVVVTRPGRWGNPFKVGDVVTPAHLHWGAVTDHAVWVPPKGASLYHVEGGWQDITVETVEQAVAMYRTYLAQTVGTSGYSLASEAQAYLAGLDLCCWCRIGDPCHADVLLEVANG
jgi:hypothetical protein